VARRLPNHNKREAVKKRTTSFMQAMEKALKEMELAGRDMQQAATEMEATSLMMQAELPPTLASMEDASREFEQVGEAVSAILGPFRGSQGEKSKKPGVLRRKLAAEQNARQSGAESDAEDSYRLDPEKASTTQRMADELVQVVCYHP
jgi:hypothetical protein